MAEARKISLFIYRRYRQETFRKCAVRSFVYNDLLGGFCAAHLLLNICACFRRPTSGRNHNVACMPLPSPTEGSLFEPPRLFGDSFRKFCHLTIEFIWIDVEKYMPSSFKGVRFLINFRIRVLRIIFCCQFLPVCRYG